MVVYLFFPYICKYFTKFQASSECPAGKAPLKVLVTGTAGQIGYSLVPLIARGDMFGPTQPIDLVMLDIEPAQTSLGGLKMELEDGAYPLLTSVFQSLFFPVL